MRAHFLQHVPFEGLGSIEPWLLDFDYEITSTQFYNNQKLPKIEEIDLLIVLGGPMSVNDIDNYSWLKDEKQFIRSMIKSGKPTLGICLGAQLIASAMSAKVYPNIETEIGWFPIQSVKKEENGVFHFPKEIEVFHWHGETFDLPVGAILLAQSVVCKNQAFQLGRHVIGLQFHLETTINSANAIIENCADELVDGKYIQKKEDILNTPSSKYITINALMGDILLFLHKS